MALLTGQAGALGVVAAKAALMYATALVGLGLGERRTVAQWSLIDRGPYRSWPGTRRNRSARTPRSSAARPSTLTCGPPDRQFGQRDNSSA